MARMRVMREEDLGQYVEGAPIDSPDKLTRFKALIRNSEIKAVVCNGLAVPLRPGMDDRQTAGAKMRHFYMIDSLKADEILNA